MTEVAPINKHGEDGTHREAFEKSFDESVTFEINGGELEMHSVTPESLEDEVPILVAPGWTNNAASFQRSIYEYYKNGRSVMATKNRHGINIAREKTLDVPNAEWRKVLGYQKMIEESGQEQVDAVAHSEGALSVLIAAKLQPEKFRNIVLVSPAGFMPNESLPKLGVRFAADMARNLAKAMLTSDKRYNTALSRVGEARNSALDAGEKPQMPAYEQFIKHLGKPKTLAASEVEDRTGAAKSNIFSAVQEVFALSSSDMREILKELSDAGVNVTILSTASDAVYPTDKLKAETQGSLHHFKTIPGGHKKLIEGEETARSVLRSLRAMQEDAEK